MGKSGERKKGGEEVGELVEGAGEGREEEGGPDRSLIKWIRRTTRAKVCLLLLVNQFHSLNVYIQI